MVVGIDLGSNTLRAVLYDCKQGEVVASYEKTVRIAQNIVKNRYIDQEAIERLIEALEAMPKEFTNTKIKAVTTQAMRIATNNEQVLQAIKDKTGISFEIISGELEAIYTTIAVKKRLQKLQIQCESFVLVDIGGGSTEVIFTFCDGIDSQSFPIGIVTAAELGMQSLNKEFEKVEAFCKDKKFDIFVSTAGTPTTVAALKLGLNYSNYDAKLINGTQLTSIDLDQALAKLLSVSKTKREELVGELRDDLIITGIGIYKKFFQLFGVKNSIVVDDGLREGVALCLCEEFTPKT